VVHPGLPGEEGLRPLLFSRGYIDPGLAKPVVLGVLIGSLLGAHVMFAAKTRLLRIIFALVIMALGIEMIYNGLAGKL